MNNDIFLKKGPFDDLEIVTLDGTLYTTKGWLVTVSDYFRTLVTQECVNKGLSKIVLKHKSKIIITIFRCVMFAYFGEQYLRKQCLEKLDSTWDICNFISGCTEFQLANLKNLADIYFSSEHNLPCP